MESSTKRRSEVGDLGPVIRAEWSTGPRTEAWTRLWKLMLGGLATQPCADDDERRGREDSDG
jgi:hypothetical protein